MEVLVATRNQGKVREIRKALRGLGLRIRSLSDFKNVPGVEEDGKSFTENALKKARFYSKVYGELTISDDSGLEVDALNGAPGVHSARFAALDSGQPGNSSNSGRSWARTIQSSRVSAKLATPRQIPRP